MAVSFFIRVAYFMLAMYVLSLYIVIEVHIEPPNGDTLMNLTLSMPKQFVDKLKKEATDSGMSYSEIVRRALDLYFGKEKKGE